MYCNNCHRHVHMYFDTLCMYACGIIHSLCVHGTVKFFTCRHAYSLHVHVCVLCIHVTCSISYCVPPLSKDIHDLYNPHNR